MSYKNIWELIGGKDVVTVPIPHSDQVLVIKIPQTAGDTYLTANEQVIIRLSDYIEELLVCDPTIQFDVGGSGPVGPAESDSTELTQEQREQLCGCGGCTCK